MAKSREQIISKMVAQLENWDSDSILELAQDVMRDLYEKMTDEELMTAYQDFIEYNGVDSMVDPDCADCEGDGLVTCNECDGDGYARGEKCDECWGTGMISCPDCYDNDMEPVKQT